MRERKKEEEGESVARNTWEGRLASGIEIDWDWQ